MSANEISPEFLERELDAIAGLVSAAADRVAEGRPVDLSPLGKRVEMVCDALVTLPGAEARRLGARLPDIVGALDAMARTLAPQAASERPDSPASHQRAAQAYGTRQGQSRRRS